MEYSTFEVEATVEAMQPEPEHPIGGAMVRLGGFSPGESMGHRRIELGGIWEPDLLRAFGARYRMAKAVRVTIEFMMPPSDDPAPETDSEESACST